MHTYFKDNTELLPRPYGWLRFENRFFSIGYQLVKIDQNVFEYIEGVEDYVKFPQGEDLSGLMTLKAILLNFPPAIPVYPSWLCGSLSN